MPKCLSKFEHDICNFNMDYNNVFSFGSLETNGTSVQLNVSSVGKLLDSAIGTQQGNWHTDRSDNPQFWTMFILLFRLPPGMSLLICQIICLIVNLIPVHFILPVAEYMFTN